jgi:hypothetical protein
MQRKVFRNSLLITGLVATAVILSAQVNPFHPNAEKQLEANLEKQVTDTLPAPDNEEGLAELDKIIERYGDNNLYLAGEIQLYEDATVLTNPQEKTSFISVNGPGGSYYEIDSVITVMNTDLTVLIDKKEKSIAVQERVSDNAGGTSPLPVISQELDAFKSYIYSITVSAAGESYKKLVIVFKEDAPVSAQNYEIVYDAHTYQIKRVAFEMADGAITDSNDDGAIDADNELVYVDEKNTEISTGYYADIQINKYVIIYNVERKGDNSLTQMSRYVNKTAEGYVPSGAFTYFDLLN